MRVPLMRVREFIGIAIMILAIFFWAIPSQQAQTVSPNPITIQSSITHTSCPVAIAGVTQYCFASDGLWVSVNGGVFSQLGVQPLPGVSSVTVCNLSGVTCGAPQTGVVSINIPSKVTVTSTAPTATLQ